MASLPKHIVMMVEKGNLVKAITNLSEEKGISMDAAKAQIDEYEAAVQAKRQKKVDAIANKQGLAPTGDDSQLTADRAANHSTDAFGSNNTPNRPLEQTSHKASSASYWAKRLVIIVAVVLILLLVFWRM